MSTITFDTLKFVKQLEASGVPPVQAEAFVLAQQQILSDVLDSTLATKGDLLSLRHDVERLEMKMESKFAVQQGLLGVLIALAVANFAKQFF